MLPATALAFNNPVSTLQPSSKMQCRATRLELRLRLLVYKLLWKYHDEWNT